METSVNVYGHFTNIPILLLVLLFGVGLYVKVGSILMTLLSYPTYLALYSLELFTAKNYNLEKRHFFRLNIPLESTKRFWMDIIASYVTIFTSITVGLQLYLLFVIPETGKYFFDSIFKGTLIPAPLAITVIVAILIIYLISWFTKVDEKKAYDKIQSLTIPSLFAKALKG